jgi:hypothetical protein
MLLNGMQKITFLACFWETLYCVNHFADVLLIYGAYLEIAKACNCHTFSLIQP